MNEQMSARLFVYSVRSFQDSVVESPFNNKCQIFYITKITKNV